jgi:hypothetical protein
LEFTTSLSAPGTTSLDEHVQAGGARVVELLDELVHPTDGDGIESACLTWRDTCAMSRAS